MNFAHVRDWVFDLDNTLYPAESTLYDEIGARMTAHIARKLGLAPRAAEQLQEHYFHRYGATVVGLMRHHGLDGADFLRDVHDVALDMLAPDPELAALITALPGRKFVYTNGGGGHPGRVLARIGLAPIIDGVFDIEAAELCPKPHPQSYRRLAAAFAIEPSRALLVEDTLRNLEPAAELGFATALIGPVHPEPRPPYVHAYAHDVKALLAPLARIDRACAAL
jgi:putative hydrolase of the HAD superfamily